MGGSQFRHVLILAHPTLVDEKAITEHIKNHCSFTFMKWDRIEKRNLKFVEDFFNSVLRPDYVKFGAMGKIWSAQQPRQYNKQIVYIL